MVILVEALWAGKANPCYSKYVLQCEQSTSPFIKEEGQHNPPVIRPLDDPPGEWCYINSSVLVSAEGELDTQQ